MKPFTTDGCSGGLNWLWKTLYRTDQPPWVYCCEVHDRAYFKGGSAQLRADADMALWSCTVANGHPIFAWIMWAFLRVCWGPFWPWSTWGWGNE